MNVVQKLLSLTQKEEPLLEIFIVVKLLKLIQISV